MQSPQFQPDDVLTDEEARRRELLALARRPSYRKILNDLEVVGQRFQPKLEPPEEDGILQPQASTSVLSHNSTGSHNGSMSPCSSDPDGATFNDSAITQSLPIRLENVTNGSLKFTDFNPSALLQYAQQQGQQTIGPTLLLPLNNDLLTVRNAVGTPGAGNGVVALHNDVVGSTTSAPPPPSAASLLAAAVLSAAAVTSSGAVNNGGGAIAPSSLTPTPPLHGNVADAAGSAAVADDSTSSSTTPTTASSSRAAGRPHQGDDAQRKREVRLLKNREAAKECRRKKKEYIKCLENRVNTLEHQNTQLIEELKNLKALYCQKSD